MSGADKDSGDLIRGPLSTEFSRWVLPCFDEPDADLALEAERAAALADEPMVAQSEDANLPAEGSVEDLVEEAVPQLTLEELEHIRQEAYQEAYNEGFQVGEKEGFHSGQLKAQQESEALLAPRLQALEQLMLQLFDPIAQQDQALEQALLELLIRLVREVVQRELVLDSHQLEKIVKEALKLLPMGVEAVRIYLNPQDFAQIKALRARHEEQWRILEDDSLLAGGCRIETEHSQIDATVETRLSRIVDQLLAQRQELLAHPLEPDIHLDLETTSRAP